MSERASRAGSCLTALLITAAVLVVGLIIVCAAAGWFLRRSITVTADPAEVGQIARTITQAKLPDRFRPLSAMKMGMFGTSVSLAAYVDEEAMEQIDPASAPEKLMDQANKAPTVLVLFRGTLPTKRGRFRAELREEALPGYQFKEVRFSGTMNGRRTRITVRCYHKLSSNTATNAPNESAQAEQQGGKDAEQEGKPERTQHEAGSTDVAAQTESKDKTGVAPDSKQPLGKSQHEPPAEKDTAGAARTGRQEDTGAAASGNASSGEAPSAKTEPAAQQDLLAAVEVDQDCDLFEVEAVQRLPNGGIAVLLRDRPDRFDLDLIRRILAQAR